MCTEQSQYVQLKLPFIDEDETERDELKCMFSPSKHNFTTQINQLYVSATVSTHHLADPSNIKMR
jgi:hypothetical protein